MPKTQGTPAALDPEEDSSVAVAPPTDDDSDTTTAAEATATDPEKAIRDIRAQYGRELQRARTEATQANQATAQLAARVEQLTQNLERLGGHIVSQDAQRQEALIRTLPPEQQMAKRVELLTREVAALRARPTQQQAPQPDASKAAEQETLRRAGQILSDISDSFDLEDDALDLRDADLDWTSEESFRRSAKTIARQRRPGGGEQPVAKPKTPAASTITKQPLSERDKLKREIMAELGIGGSNSARASGAIDDAPPEEIGKVQAGYRSKGGNRKQLAELTRIRDERRANMAV